MHRLFKYVVGEAQTLILKLYGYWDAEGDFHRTKEIPQPIVALLRNMGRYAFH